MENTSCILQDIRQYADKHTVPCISSATEQRLVQYLMTYKPVHCLEIGWAIGYSTISIAQTIQSRNGLLMSCEISHPSYMMSLRYYRQSNLRNIRSYHTSFHTLPLDLLISHALQFVFIDATKSDYATFLDRVLPYCASWAHIVCDDMLEFTDKTDHLLTYLTDKGISYDLLPLDDGDGVLVCQV